MFFSFFFMVFEPIFGAYGVYDSQRLVQTFFLIFFLVFFAPRYWLGGVAGVAIFLFFCAGFVSCFLAPKLLWAMLEWGRLFLLFMLAFSLARWREGSLRFSVASLNGVAILFCVRFLVGLFVISFAGGGIEVLAAGFSNHRHFAEFFIALSAFLAFSLLSIRRFWLLSIIPFSLAWVVLFLGGGRASLLALLTSFFMYVWLGCERPFRVVAVFLLAGLVGWVVSFFLILQDPSMAGSAQILREGGSGRVTLWLSAFDLWLGSLFFGVGPMHFAFYSREIAAHPHSLVMQILSEWGGIAFVAVLIFFAAVFWRLFEDGRALNVRVKVAFSVIVGLLVSSFFGGVFVVPVVEFFFFIMLGVVMSCDSFSWRLAIFQSASIRTFAAGFGALVLLAFLWRDIDVSRGAVIDAPRFWQNGGIPHD